MFAYCSNNPIMGYDPTGEWNWGSFLMAVATVAVVTATVALAVATVGTVMGVAAPVVTAAVKLTVAGGIVEGSKEIINQLAEDGEVTDTGAVATETRDGGLGGFVDCMTGNASKFVADSIGFLVSVSMSGADSYNGRTFESFMKGASTEAQDELLLSTISWALDTLLVPGATEKMVDALEIILPGRR